MKKIVVLAFVFFIPVFAFSQSAVSLDTALKNSTSYLNGRIPARTKVVVLNFTSDWPKLSDYVIEELIGYIVNEGALTVVDRANLEMIRREMDFQLSGEVSDATAQSIGKKLGAQTIISGAITTIGNAYRLRIRAISVETAEIVGMQNVDVAQDSRSAALTGTAYAGAPAAASANSSRAAASAPKSFNVDLSTLPFVRNAAPLAAQWDKVLISFPPFPVDVSSFKRVTIKAKYFDDRGAEIKQADEMVMVTLIYDLSGDTAGPPLGPGPNTPLKEFNVGGRSGSVSTAKGAPLKLTKSPGGILFQNNNAKVKFIEVTEISFHN